MILGRPMPLKMSAAWGDRRGKTQMTDLNTMTPVRALIADDHPLVLVAIESLVESVPELRVVGRAIGSKELFNALGRLECDVLVTDLFMSRDVHCDGIENIRMLKALYPNLALVVLTMSTDVDVLRNAIALGVGAILSKQDRIELLYVALATALGRGCYLGPTIRSLFADAPHIQRVEHLRQILSKREFEVLRHYVSGFGITEIARQTGRSVKTISAQKRKAMKKLSLRSDVDLYRFATSHGLVSEGRSS
jgi:two-component system, NarL family, captular synthesis response regulator RcsB